MRCLSYPHLMRPRNVCMRLVSKNKVRMFHHSHEIGCSKYVLRKKESNMAQLRDICCGSKVHNKSAEREALHHTMQSEPINVLKLMGLYARRDRVTVAL